MPCKIRIADFVSISRIVLAIFTLWFLHRHSEWCKLLCLFLTVLVIYMDGLDGYLARKFNQATTFGATLDIVADRIVEMAYWIVFASLGWVSYVIPLIFLIRGNLVDTIRGFACMQGYTAFGKNTMMQNPLNKFLVSSNFSRFTYAIAKALAFCLLIAGHCSIFEPFHLFPAARFTVVIATIFCLIRGLPVLIEGSRFITSE